MDFLPALVLLAVVGVLGLERVLADRPVWRRAVRWGWGLLLGFSVLFNVLVSVENYAYAACSLGTTLAQEGRVPEAIHVFEKALRIKPDCAEAHNNLGATLGQAGKLPEAIDQYEQALRIKPDDADAHNNLGNALAQAGKVDEAIDQYEQALRIKPDDAEAHNNLGNALMQAGKVDEAIGHYEQAIRISPDFAEVRYNLGLVLVQQGRVPEAVEQLVAGTERVDHDDLKVGSVKWRVVVPAIPKDDQLALQRFARAFSKTKNRLGRKRPRMDTVLDAAS